MKKLIYNRTLFVIATVVVLTTLILSSLNYIDINSSQSKKFLKDFYNLLFN